MPVLLVLFLLFTPIASYAQTVEEGYQAYDDGDYEKAKHIFHTLAEQGNPKAMNAIGLLHSEGKAYALNRQIACDWFEKAAHKNYVPAQFNFAKCFDKAGGRPKASSSYIQWLETAADHGDMDAILFLMMHYLNKDNKLAEKWGQKAVDQGSTFALVALWDNNINYIGPEPSIIQIGCIYLFNVLLQTDTDYCEYF